MKSITDLIAKWRTGRGYSDLIRRDCADELEAVLAPRCEHGHRGAHFVDDGRSPSCPGGRAIFLDDDDMEPRNERENDLITEGWNAAMRLREPPVVAAVSPTREQVEALKVHVGINRGDGAALPSLHHVRAIARNEVIDDVLALYAQATEKKA